VGECGEIDVAVHEWVPSGRVGHEEADPSEPAAEQGVSTAFAQQLLGGRVLCHERTGARGWSGSTRVGVYAIASRQDGDTLVH